MSAEMFTSGHFDPGDVAWAIRTAPSVGQSRSIADLYQVLQKVSLLDGGDGGESLSQNGVVEEVTRSRTWQGDRPVG